MKFIMSFMFIGIIVLSCKKEQQTENTINTDSIITDTVNTDTAGTTPAPMPSDTVRTDTTALKNSDTAQTAKTRTQKK
ncbi:hypothetical protein [Chryseobacterium flavum]|uniref:hypothetical protein n=1 Tax=Chryseobacterium flavum TaxID=415851 RepID=UPI0028ABDA55|nr:hypothetical protein [Chryseobacterium flavum]